MLTIRRGSKDIALPDQKIRDYLDPEYRSLEPPKLSAILREHAKWLESGGQVGKRANFFSTVLAGADFSNADLRWCGFVRADLRGACFRRANLEAADFNGADLRYADLSGVRGHRASFTAADCRETLFTKADLKDSFFIDTRLDAAGFVGADLRARFFLDSSSESTDFRKARLDGLDLRQWSLKPAQLRGAYGSLKKDTTTTLPDGLTLISSDEPGAVIRWEGGNAREFGRSNR